MLPTSSTGFPPSSADLKSPVTPEHLFSDSSTSLEKAEQHIPTLFPIRPGTQVLTIGSENSLIDFNSKNAVIALFKYLMPYVDSQQITKLKFVNCHFMSIASQQFFSSLATLRYLHALEIELPKDGKDAFYDSLGKELYYLVNLQEFSLINAIPTEARGVTALLPYLSSCPKLHTLKLKARVTDDQLADVLRSLVKNPNLATLDLSGNTFSDKGAHMLSEWLQTCPTLKTLIVANNRIGEEGMFALLGGIGTRNIDLVMHEEVPMVDQSIRLPPTAQQLEEVFGKLSTLEEIGKDANFMKFIQSKAKEDENRQYDKHDGK